MRLRACAQLNQAGMGITAERWRHTRRRRRPWRHRAEVRRRRQKFRPPAARHGTMGAGRCGSAALGALLPAPPPAPKGRGRPFLRVGELGMSGQLVPHVRRV